MKVFASPSNKKFVDNLVLAVGGGAIIDEAKIYAKKHKKKCIAIPTTAAGATGTSHGVIWGKIKKDINTDIPYTIILDDYPKTLPKEVLQDTFYDCESHIEESLLSINATVESCRYARLAEKYLKEFEKTKNLYFLRLAGHFAGYAIEITGTNIIHKMSYPLTLRGWTHGKAVGFVSKLLRGSKIPKKMWK